VRNEPHHRPLPEIAVRPEPQSQRWVSRLRDRPHIRAMNRPYPTRLSGSLSMAVGSPAAADKRAGLAPHRTPKSNKGLGVAC
jgi:hypothetical protein